LIEAAPKAAFKPASMLLKRLIHAATGQGEILWNFEKFLIDRNGAVIKRFAPDTKPQDETIVRAIEAALAAA
jgi:glutathione peroxidase